MNWALSGFNLKEDVGFKGFFLLFFSCSFHSDKFAKHMLKDYYIFFRFTGKIEHTWAEDSMGLWEVHGWQAAMDWLWVNHGLVMV